MDESTGLSLPVNPPQPNIPAQVQTPEPHHFHLKKWEVVLGVFAVIVIGGFFIFQKYY